MRHYVIQFLNERTSSHFFSPFVVFLYASSILSLLISLLLALSQWWQIGSSVSLYGFYVCLCVLLKIGGHLFFSLLTLG